MSDDDTRLSRRRAGDVAPAADADDDATAISVRRTEPVDGDATRPSRRRIAESATEPGAPPEDTTQPAASRRPLSDGVLRPPAGLAAEVLEDGTVAPPRAGEFGDAPQHYYPRIRHTQDAAGAGVWPEPPRASFPLAEVIDPAERDARRATDLRALRRRQALVVGGAVASVAAAVVVAVALL